MSNYSQKCPKCARVASAFRSDDHDNITIIYFQCYADEYVWVLVVKQEKEVSQ